MNRIEEALMIEAARRLNPDYPLKRSRFCDMLRILAAAAWLAMIAMGIYAGVAWLFAD